MVLFIYISYISKLYYKKSGIFITDITLIPSGVIKINDSSLKTQEISKLCDNIGIIKKS